MRLHCAIAGAMKRQAIRNFSSRPRVRSAGVIVTAGSRPGVQVV
jgi:hypothetical protein